MLIGLSEAQRKGLEAMLAKAERNTADARQALADRDSNAPNFSAQQAAYFSAKTTYEIESKQAELLTAALAADDQLKEIAAALEAVFELEKGATPGPWHFGEGRSEVLCEDGILDEGGNAVMVYCGRSSGDFSKEDYASVIATRNVIPKLRELLEKGGKG